MFYRDRWNRSFAFERFWCIFREDLPVRGYRKPVSSARAPFLARCGADADLSRQGQQQALHH